jgi:hypothetical protein
MTERKTQKQLTYKIKDTEERTYNQIIKEEREIKFIPSPSGIEEINTKIISHVERHPA